MSRKYTQGEIELMRMMDQGSNNLNGSQPQLTVNQGEVEVLAGNFNVTITKKYFTLTGGTYTAITDAALNATLQTALPTYLFCTSDSLGSGYKKLSDTFPVSNASWSFTEAGIYGVHTFESFDSTDTAVVANLQKGDYVQVFTSSLPGAGTTTMGLIIQRCAEIAFGSLHQNIQGGAKLGVISIRETMSNDSAVYSAQNQQTMYFFQQSILGKTSYDGLPVQSAISGFQYNQNIVDISVGRTLNRYQGFEFLLEYTTPTMTLTFNCGSITK